jgi:hypothetical protein
MGEPMNIKSTHSIKLMRSLLRSNFHLTSEPAVPTDFVDPDQEAAQVLRSSVAGDLSLEGQASLLRGSPTELHPDI